MVPRIVQVRLGQFFRAGERHAHGWSLAEKHSAIVDSALQSAAATSAGAIVVLDFDGIESMSASYVKRILLWYLVAGERFVGGLKSPPEGPSASNVYSAFMNAAADVHEELTVVLEHANKACFEVVQLDGDTIGRARLVGGLDRTNKETFLRVLAAGEASAPLFHDRFHDEHIGVTAWNNRLNDLHTRRLVWREKRVRQFVFRPFVKEIVDG